MVTETAQRAPAGNAPRHPRQPMHWRITQAPPSVSLPEYAEPARAPEPSSPSEPTPRIARSPVGDGTARRLEGRTATDKDFEPSPTTTEISELQGTKNHE